MSCDDVTYTHTKIYAFIWVYVKYINIKMQVAYASPLSSLFAVKYV